MHQQTEIKSEKLAKQFGIAALFLVHLICGAFASTGVLLNEECTIILLLRHGMIDHEA